MIADAKPQASCHRHLSARPGSRGSRRQSPRPAVPEVPAYTNGALCILTCNMAFGLDIFMSGPFFYSKERFRGMSEPYLRADGLLHGLKETDPAEDPGNRADPAEDPGNRADPAEDPGKPGGSGRASGTAQTGRKRPAMT